MDNVTIEFNLVFFMREKFKDRLRSLWSAAVFFFVMVGVFIKL